LGTDWETLFLTGVSMAVAAIPESLPAMVTITLALGAQRLLKRQALMRRLPAVETLGSVTYICSDKTGTLTENHMTVTLLDVAGNTESFDTLNKRGEELLEARLLNESAPDLAALSMVVRVGALCNDAVLEEEEDGDYHAIGDPTEGALVLAAHELGWDLDALQEEWPRVAEIPFTSDRKRMTTIHRMTPMAEQYVRDVPWAASSYVFLTKGAVDGLLEITDSVLVDKEFVPLDDKLRRRIIDTNERYALEGQRVLGMAVRVWDDPELPEKITEDMENHVVFVGMSY
jgi:Ca2+-transporting ATPase